MPFKLKWAILIIPIGNCRTVTQADISAPSCFCLTNSDFGSNGSCQQRGDVANRFKGVLSWLACNSEAHRITPFFFAFLCILILDKSQLGIIENIKLFFFLAFLFGRLNNAEQRKNVEVGLTVNSTWRPISLTGCVSKEDGILVVVEDGALFDILDHTFDLVEPLHFGSLMVKS